MRGVSERSDTDSGVNCHLWWIPGPARQYPYQDDGKQRFGGLLSYYFAVICYITSLRATPDAGCPLNRSGPAAQRGWHEWLAGVAAAGQETIIRMRIRRFFCPVLQSGFVTYRVG